MRPPTTACSSSCEVALPLTFALVHAAWHGPWCWAAIARELKERGHRAVAVELPCEDTDAGASAYAEVVLEALTYEEGDVVLVGHSLGGLTIPLVAERRPVSRLVFVCALLPEPGRSWEEQLRDDPEILAGGFDGLAVDELGRSYWRDREAATQTLYHDVPRDVAEGVAARLRRQARAPYAERCPLRRPPDVECDYIVARDDRVLSTSWARRAAQERLGIEAQELPGGHSPFLSRPATLAQLLTPTISPEHKSSPSVPPEDRVRVLTSGYAAFNRRDIEVALQMLDPDVEWPNIMDRTTLHGHDAVREYWQRQFDVIDSFVEAEEFHEVGDRVVVFVHQRVYDKRTGEQVADDRPAHVFTFSDAQVIRMVVYPDREEALRVAGAGT